MSEAGTYVYGTIAVNGHRTNHTYCTQVRHNETLTAARTRLTRLAIERYRLQAGSGQSISFLPEMHQTSTGQRGHLV